MDYYLQDISRLNGQPKKTIADYVEQNGILVAPRFNSLEEARNAHRDILLRSEHPQEYDGVSGLLYSFRLHSKSYLVRNAKNLEEVKQIYFEKENSENGTPLYRQFCIIKELDENEFKKQTTFSAWKCIDGFNRTIIADSAIAKRYHIMTHRNKKEDYFSNYTVIENRQIEKEFLDKLPIELKNGLNKLIETYEKIRNLEHFDPNHCPIMEFQTHKEKDYFLQYHRTRDFSPANFVLDRPLQEGEMLVPFVRGATPKEGKNLKITVYYSYKGNWQYDPESEDGSFDFHYNEVFSELESKKRKLQINSAKTVGHDLESLVCKHAIRSKIFKPEVSIIFPINSLIKDNEVILGDDGCTYDGIAYWPRNPILKEGETIFNFSKESDNGHNSFMNVYLISDGKRAHIKRLD